MKKMIFISTHTMRIGGVERSLIGFLEAIDYSKYNVDLFLYNHEGELMTLIPRDVNLLPEIKEYAGLLKPVSYLLKECLFSLILVKFLAKIHEILKVILSEKNSEGFLSNTYHTYLCKYANLFLPRISRKRYDVSLAFLHPNYFERSKIFAKKYIGWVHTDYSSLKIDNLVELKMWQKYDNIVAVSESSLTSFKNVFPSLNDKLMVIENILSSSFILQQANEFDVRYEMPKIIDELIFCTVGRFSFAKNMESIPTIAKNLSKLNLKFKWYLIGFGEDEEKIRNAIVKENMQEYVCILGKKNNPYPYIKSCDIYIQPSRFEGKAVTVREAQILCKPVIITDYPSSADQLINNFDGIIVPMEADLCANAIFNIVIDNELLRSFIKHTTKNDYTNISELKKIYALINGN